MFKFFKKNNRNTSNNPISNISEPMSSSSTEPAAEIFTYQVQLGFATIKVYYRYTQRQNNSNTVTNSPTNNSEDPVYDTPTVHPKSIQLK